jgi:hypothetical protein
MVVFAVSVCRDVCEASAIAVLVAAVAPTTGIVQLGMTNKETKSVKNWPCRTL